MPTIYNASFNAVDPDNTGETSVNALSRVLSTSSLPAATIDRVRFSRLMPMPLGTEFRMSPQIVNLVSTRPRVSKLEFFVALALVALAQSGKGAYSDGNMFRTHDLPP